MQTYTRPAVSECELHGCERINHENVREIKIEIKNEQMTLTELGFWAEEAGEVVEENDRATMNSLGESTLLRGRGVGVVDSRCR